MFGYPTLAAVAFANYPRGHQDGTSSQDGAAMRLFCIA